MRRVHVKRWHGLWAVFEDGCLEPGAIRPTEDEAQVEAHRLCRREREWKLVLYRVSGQVRATETRRLAVSSSSHADRREPRRRDRLV